MPETPTAEPQQRPWWKRRALWLIGAAALLALVVGMAIEQSGKPAAVPYSAFLDQLDAGNVASVTFKGTVIEAQLKRPADSAVANGVPQTTFTSRMPDFGDPTLIPELRKQHAAINVTAPSAWGWLLGRLPWPMLVFIGAMLVAGVVRLMRGRRSPSAAAAPMPMHGVIGLVSGLFAKGRQAEPSTPEGGEKPAR